MSLFNKPPESPSEGWPGVWVDVSYAAADYLLANAHKLKPGTALPGRAGKDFGFVPPANTGWKCQYCGGLRASSYTQCPGCGAART